jgi:hypothetical protein
MANGPSRPRPGTPHRSPVDPSRFDGTASIRRLLAGSMRRGASPAPRGRGCGRCVNELGAEPGLRTARHAWSRPRPPRPSLVAVSTRSMARRGPTWRRQRQGRERRRDDVAREPTQAMSAKTALRSRQLAPQIDQHELVPADRPAALARRVVVRIAGVLLGRHVGRVVAGSPAAATIRPSAPDLELRHRRA